MARLCRWHQKLALRPPASSGALSDEDLMRRRRSFVKDRLGDGGHGTDGHPGQEQVGWKRVGQFLTLLHRIADNEARQ